MGAFERFGYFALKEHHNVEFRNLHEDDHVSFEALDQDLKPVNIRLAKSLFNCYLVSVARMKTHLQVIVTLTIKNIAIGAIYNPDRHSLAWQQRQPGVFSHDPQPLNLHIARLDQALTPALAVIDGVVGMEGEGPVKGTPIASEVALAGTNALAVDIVGSEVLGKPRRCDLRNYAMQDTVPEGHWFWNPEISGRILLEHGVHFFDLASWALGTKAVDTCSMGVERKPGRKDPEKLRRFFEACRNV
jgi:uncharacterized protein (DUF362 family)